MAVRHIKAYFNDVANQYLQLQKEVEEFEEEAQKNLCDPDKIEVLKQMVQPVKDTYMFLSYVMYLLNMPNREQKKNKYQRMNEKLLKSIPHDKPKQGLMEQKDECLKEIKKLNG